MYCLFIFLHSLITSVRSISEAMHFYVSHRVEGFISCFYLLSTTPPKKEITVIPLISTFVRRINIVITDDVPVAYNKNPALLGLGRWLSGACPIACAQCSGLSENGFHKLL